MPKPVLSDSLFNASDVAEAIIDTIDLSVVNSNLGVVDKSSIFVASSNTQILASQVGGCYSFNGFMFVNLRFEHTGSFSNNDTVSLATISDSNFYPNARTSFPTISYQGDYANIIQINTDGTIESTYTQNSGDSAWFAVINGFYRFA
tara:strand:+ start:1924 stop:2364 length:441 start_codon:yes stop_codon:yes gene_type:complete